MGFLLAEIFLARRNVRPIVDQKHRHPDRSLAQRGVVDLFCCLGDKRRSLDFAAPPTWTRGRLRSA
jgi:hypothetical protein